jgi:hypothetical protein
MKATASEKTASNFTYEGCLPWVGLSGATFAQKTNTNQRGENP